MEELEGLLIVGIVKKPRTITRKFEFEQDWDFHNGLDLRDGENCLLLRFSGSDGKIR